MAEFTVTFKDVEEGVSIEVNSDVKLPDEITEEFIETLSDAEKLGLRMTELIQQEYFGHNDCCSGQCDCKK
jgi:hypothetical protein